MGEFNSAVVYVLQNEGGLQEDPKDSGGITNYGISLRFLRSIKDSKKYGINAETINSETIKELTLDQAKSIYKQEFWDHAPFERINNQNNCNFIFDMAVNMGISPAIKCAQRSCWAVLKQRNILVDDGILGNQTIELMNRCSIYLLAAMRSERAGDYRLIAEKNPNDKEYLNGWLNRSYGEKK